MIDLVLGLGQGGARLGKAFAKVYETDSRYFNLTSLDFKAMRVPKHHTFILEEGGSGRDPSVGEEIVRANESELETFVKDSVNLKKAETVVVCVGLGGGSGSGYLFPVLELLVKLKKRIILVATLPQKKEGLPAQPNALQAINRLISNYIGQEIPKERQVVPILVDNDYCFERYGVRSEDDYWGRVNKGIAFSLRRFYTLTTNFADNLDIASGYNALDYREFEKILHFKNGFLDIREVIVDSLSDVDAVKQKLKTSSLLSGSMDINTTKAYIVSVALPSSWKDKKNINTFVQQVFDMVSKMTKTPYVLGSSYFNSSLKSARVSLLLAGVTRSHSLDKHLKNAAKNIEKFKSKGDVEKLDISSIMDY